ncbi:sulfotransferase family protein [Paenibacillus sp. YIM B09110]|uniref:sulfotransferase family protein n=1 Tax=Paenibacillus sp. YIM B09110 TaxID=3126102 RepID=UPI00301BBBBC
MYDLAEGCFSLGCRCFEEGELHLALKHFNKALELGYEEYEVIRNRSQVYAAMKLTGKAIRDAYHCLRLLPDDSHTEAVIQQIRALKAELEIPIVKTTETELTNNKDVLPYFLIVGTQKGGTTSLYKYLLQHPNVHPAVTKEIHYFDELLHFGLDWYLTHFPESLPHGDITGEATPYYLFHPHVATRIKAALPAVKIIVLLRNPIERAFSHYQMMVRRGLEKLSFSEALHAEQDRIATEYARMERDNTYFSPTCTQYSYLKRGLYSEQLERWFQQFPREQILVIRSEQLLQDTAASYKQVLQFLQLPDCDLEQYAMHHEGGYKDEIDSDTRSWLEQYFEKDQRRLALQLDGECYK